MFSSTEFCVCLLYHTRNIPYQVLSQLVRAPLLQHYWHTDMLQYSFCIMTVYTIYDHGHQNGLKIKPEVNWDNYLRLYHYCIWLTVYCTQYIMGSNCWVDKNNMWWTLMGPQPVPSWVMMLVIVIIALKLLCKPKTNFKPLSKFKPFPELSHF